MCDDVRRASTAVAPRAASHACRRRPEKSLVNPKERRYYLLLVLASLAIYGFFAIGVAGAAVAAPEALGGMLVYVVVLPLVFFMVQGLMIGRLRGTGIRVSERQFPELLQMAKRHAATLGMSSVPDLFVLKSGGVLNAFATRLLGRDFVVIYSDELALAEARGEGAVSFIVAHELAHVRRGHLKHRWLTLPGRMIPYFGAAWSRAASTPATGSARTASRRAPWTGCSCWRRDASCTTA